MLWSIAYILRHKRYAKTTKAFCNLLIENYFRLWGGGKMLIINELYGFIAHNCKILWCLLIICIVLPFRL